MSWFFSSLAILTFSVSSLEENLIDLGVILAIAVDTLLIILDTVG